MANKVVIKKLVSAELLLSSRRQIFVFDLQKRR